MYYVSQEKVDWVDTLSLGVAVGLLGGLFFPRFAQRLLWFFGQIM
jgi:hypothetical protein